MTAVVLAGSRNAGRFSVPHCSHLNARPCVPQGVPPDPPVFQIFTRPMSNWNKIEPISEAGGNGVVWRVKDDSGRECAMKVLRRFAEPAKADRRRKRFLKEIRTLEDIHKRDIKGIMPLIEYSIDVDEPWFAMPVATPLAPPEFDRSVWVLTTMITVSNIIAELHVNGYVHRDIKPSNLLLLNNEVVVSDFGLVFSDDDDRPTCTGEGMGSVGYMAPELVGRLDEPPFKADVYSIAKTTWALLTGNSRPPNHQLDAADALSRHSVDCSNIPHQELDELLRFATHRSPSSRPTVRQFREGLEACLPNDSRPMRKTGSPADLADALFQAQREQNCRDQETQSIIGTIRQELKQAFVFTWKPIVAKLGWNTNGGMGGRSMEERRLRGFGWHSAGRFFFGGRMENKQCKLVLLLLHHPNHGESRLDFEALVLVEIGAEVHEIASLKVDTFAHGPALKHERRRLLEFVSDKEVQYRAIQKLREVVEK